jgi:hypothetical protein
LESGLQRVSLHRAVQKTLVGISFFKEGGLEKIIRNTSVFSHHATPPALRRYPKLNLFDTENKPQQRRTGENLGVSTDG